MKKEYPLDIETYKFGVIVPVQLRFSDFDRFGHANNSAMQNFYDLGRAAYMERVCGKDFARLPQTMLVVSYTTDFMQQVHFDDDIEVRAAVHHIGNKSVGMLMAIVNRATGEVCSASVSVMAGFDKTTEKSMPILDEWRARIAEIEGHEF